MLGPGEVCVRATWPIRSELTSGLSSMKRRLGVFLPSPPPRRVTPSASNSPVSIYKPGWRKPLWESPWKKSQCPRPGLEPRSLDPETSLLTMSALTNYMYLLVHSHRFFLIKPLIVLKTIAITITVQKHALCTLVCQGGIYCPGTGNIRFTNIHKYYFRAVWS